MKSDKNKILRNYLNSKKLIRAVGAHDGLSAKLIGEAGFETVWIRPTFSPGLRNLGAVYELR